MTPDLRASIERFRDEMEAVDGLTHVLLKGHLLLEESLSAILDQYVFHRNNLEEARLSFAQKISLARALCLRKNDLGEWELIAAINALRNDFAHRLNSTDRAKKLAKVKQLYFREAADYEKIAEVKKETDVVIVFNACAHCAGFLSSYLADSREFRQLIHGIDRQLHPDLPPFEL